MTIKFKLSEIQTKAGQIPDFALFVKNDVHDSKATNPSNHAGKYVSYVNGDIGEQFYTKGIKYDPNLFFMCKNAVDFEEDRIGPHRSVLASASKTSRTVVSDMVEVSGSSDDESQLDNTEEGDLGKVTDYESDAEERVDVCNMAKYARKVSFGAPSRETSASESSGGVHVYGRGAEKVVDKRKKAKKVAMKKRSKASAKKTETDVLDNFQLLNRSKSLLKSKGRKSKTKQKK